MDILYLIDALESRLVESRRIPLTSKLIVDEEECFDIINEMRSRIPEEVRQAQRTERESGRILAQAHEEAERVVALARERAEVVLAEHETVKGAQARADTVLERAQREALRIKDDADNYVIEILTQLEAQLDLLLNTVRNGVRVMQEGRVGLERERTGEEAE
jgi:hypothetical protein